MILTGKVAVVTGASAGIGAAVARELSAAGAKLILNGRRLQRLSDLAQQLPNESAALAADIADPATPPRLLELALRRFERADILVNNAGLLTIAPIDNVDLDAMTRMIRVNYEALVRSSYIFARHFKSQRAGAIINVSSIGAYVTGPMMGVYCGTKHAVEGFTAALRIELAGTGVKVGSIAPGSTETDMTVAIREKFGDAAAPQGAMLDPEDIARGVRFMLEQSDRANVARLSIYSSSETH